MSVSPTEDALIVALDFEGELESVIHHRLGVILNYIHNRCPQSRAFGPGGHASRSFQYCYFESREKTVMLSLLHSDLTVIIIGSIS